MNVTKQDVEEALDKHVRASEVTKRFAAKSLSASEKPPNYDPKEMAKAFEESRKAQEEYERKSKEYFGF